MNRITYTVPGMHCANCEAAIRQEVGADTFAECFKFSFVRNPYDKAVSQSVYMQRRNNLRDLIREAFAEYEERAAVVS